MTDEPQSLMLQLLREMRNDIANMRGVMATKDDLAILREEMATKKDVAGLRGELRSDMHSLRADVASDLITTRKELGEQIVGLRHAVIEYHTSVIGHGVLISELKARVRRVEQHLNLTPDAH